MFIHDGTGAWRVRTAGNGNEFTRTHNAVRVIDVAEAGQKNVELRLNPGKTARIEVRGPDGRPLTGAHVAGLTEYEAGATRLSGSTSPILSLDPETPRAVYAYHAGKKLAGSAGVTAGKPAVLRLAPVATLKGRLVDADGVPLAGVSLFVVAADRYAGHLYRAVGGLNTVHRTDAEGRFVLPPLVPGMRFSLSLRRGEKYFRGKPPFGTLTFKPGGSRDLGDRTVVPAN